MKKILLSVITIFITTLSPAQETEIIIIGNIHQEVPNYNPDILFGILVQVKPDIILHELDSSFFTPDFKFKGEVSGNEMLATMKYVSDYPETIIRPFDFEGRNEYRKINGFNPTENLAVSLLDSLYTEKLLTNRQSKAYQKYNQLLEPLKKAASGAPKNFNNAENDKLCKERQYYQYTKLLNIMAQRPEFIKHTFTKPDGEKITYKKGFQLASEFWDLRNQTMAKNILKIAHGNTGKKIVVLTGFMHRYYIISELKKLTKNNRSIVIKEFYEK